MGCSGESALPAARRASVCVVHPLSGSLAEAQDLTEDEETVEDSVIEDEDDEAEVEEDDPTDLVSAMWQWECHASTAYCCYCCRYFCN